MGRIETLSLNYQCNVLNQYCTLVCLTQVIPAILIQKIVLRRFYREGNHKFLEEEMNGYSTQSLSPFEFTMRCHLSKIEEYSLSTIFIILQFYTHSNGRFFV